MFEDFNIPSELMPSDPRFGVGPSLIPVEYVQRLADTKSALLGTSHRKPAVKNLVKEIQDGLKKFYNLPEGYEIVLGNGGATYLFDMIGLGMVEKSSIHYTTGEFSSKWFKSHNNIPWINATEKATDYGKGQNPELVDGHDMICCTLNETSTGVILNSIPDISGRDDVLLAVDATSGAGQVKLDITKTDLYFFSPQKVFASEGGLYICIMSPKALARAKKLGGRETYTPEIMKWSHAIENSKKSQTYNTPAISTLFYLNEQLKDMNKLGEDKVISMALEKAAFIYDWAESRPYLSPYIEDKSFRSHAVATIDVIETFPLQELLDKLRKDKIVFDIEGYRKLGRNQLRVSLFHNISLENLKKLTAIISLGVESYIKNN